MRVSVCHSRALPRPVSSVTEPRVGWLGDALRLGDDQPRLAVGVIEAPVLEQPVLGTRRCDMRGAGPVVVRWRVAPGDVGKLCAQR